VGVTALSFAASTIIAAYLFDRAGVRLAPLAVLAVALSASAVLWLALRPRTDWRRRDDLLGFTAVVLTSWAWLLWRSRPWYLPLGGGPDITHHLLLVDYIERHWHLVHDPAVEPYLGEMVHYTPGVHILTTMVGAWLRSDGLHALHGTVSALVALKLGFVYLIALRLIPDRMPRLPLATASAVLVLLAHAYVLDSFMHDSFLAQAVSESFAIVMWWTLVVWDETPWASILAVFALAGTAAFLTWPVWIGPPGVALGLTLLLRREPSLRARAAHGLVAALPIALVAVLYIMGRTGWLQMTTTEGAVLPPLVDKYGRWFLASAGVGLLIAPFLPRTRATLFLLAGILLQAAALYLLARAHGNTSPYLAFKTFYLAPYPLAVLAVLPAAAVWRAARIPATLAAARLVAWMLCAFVSYKVLRPIVTSPRETPAISEPLFLASRWARDHVPTGCVAYMVADDDTSYWLHLAMLRNRRMSSRTGDNNTYNLGETIVRWYEPGGLPYAIADLPALNRDVREDLNVLAQFDTAAVVKRKGPSACADANLPPPP